MARLALDDYQELTPTIQLVLHGSFEPNLEAFDLCPVITEADCQSLSMLVRHNHAEGASTQDVSVSPEVTQGLVASYRKKWPACQFFLVHEDDVDCAYGAGERCANGMGMVEDLFTLPDFRKRGLATAIIAQAISHVRSQGAEQILIGALTTEAPKRLYVTLGFIPICVTREYIKHL